MNVVESETNLEFLELDRSTLESKTGFAVKTKHNLKVHADASKIRGKKAAFDTDANFDLTMKNACEVTSDGGRADLAETVPQRA